MLVLNVYFNLVVLTSFVEISRFMSIIPLVYMDFYVNNNCARYQVYLNFVVLTQFGELSSFVLIIPLLYMDFYVHNFKLCLL